MSKSKLGIFLLLNKFSVLKLFFFSKQTFKKSSFSKVNFRLGKHSSNLDLAISIDFLLISNP